MLQITSISSDEVFVDSYHMYLTVHEEISLSLSLCFYVYVSMNPRFDVSEIILSTDQQRTPTLQITTFTGVPSSSLGLQSTPVRRPRASSRTPLSESGNYLGRSDLGIMSTPRSSRKSSIGTPSSVASSVGGGGRRSVSTPSSVAFGTPASVRYSVLGGQGGADSDLMSTTSSPGGATAGGDAVIWGTDVNVNESWKRFEYFLINFKDPNSTDSDAHYLRKLSELRRTGGRNLNVDMQHLRSFSRTRDFARHVKMYPQEMVPLMDMIVNQVYDTYIMTRDSILGEDDEEEKKQDDEEDEDEQASRRIMVRPCNLHVSTKMRDLDPKDIDQLVSIRGMIIRSSNIIPDLKHAFFRCSICQNETDVSVDRGRIDEPVECERCNGKHTFEMVHNRCLYVVFERFVSLIHTSHHLNHSNT